MSGGPQRLHSIELDEESLSAASRDQEQERQIAIFDLLEDNRFTPEGAEGGPYDLRISLIENRLALDITLEDTTLTIIGRREKADVDTEAIYRESPTADYRRVFELVPAIDPARIDAKLEHGVLTVLLPKSERAKPRKIAVSE